MRRRRLATTVGVVALAASALTLAPRAEASSSAPDSCDWTQFGHDSGHSGAALDGCSTLNRLSAPSLTPKWGFKTNDSVTASPAVANGHVYVGDWAGNFYSFNAESGPNAAPEHTFQITDTNGVAFGRIVSSAAVVDYDGRSIVLFGGGATLYALDGDTLAPVAEACLDVRNAGTGRCSGTSAGQQVEIETSPNVRVNGNGSVDVVVGIDVHNDANVGRTGVIKLNLHRQGASGYALDPQWKFDPEAAAGNPVKPGDTGVYNGADMLTYGSGTGFGCASVWGSPAVDWAGGQIFFGTGSCGHPETTAGEDVWALDLATGSMQWRFEPPRPFGPNTDDDFGSSPNLLPNGLVGVGSKDGWYYALRRHSSSPTGDLVWSNHVGESGHADPGFAVGGVIGVPAVGKVTDHHGTPQDTIFVTTAISTPVAQPVAGFPTAANFDTTLARDPGRMFSLHAIDAATGTLVWRSPLSRQSYGHPTYANGVVMVPSTFDLQIMAFDADTGVVLSSSPTLGAPSSAAVPVGDSVYFGTGTRTTDAEFKAFGASAADAFLGASPLSPASGVFAYRVTVPTPSIGS